MVFENFLPANMDNEVVIGHRLRRCVLVVVHLAQMIPSDGSAKTNDPTAVGGGGFN